EDGIRDFHVTGVQTCALPIYPRAYGPLRGEHHRAGDSPLRGDWWSGGPVRESPGALQPTGWRGRAGRSQAGAPDSRAAREVQLRSEERRVGKEWRTRMSAAVA